MVCQQFVSASPYSAILEYHDVKSVNNVNISAWCCWHRTAYVVYVQIKARAYIVILSKMALQGDAEETNCWIVVIFVFFAHKKYSLSFTKLRLNHWCHMDYFNDVLATFLCVDRGNTLAVYGRVRELSECIKNILICVLKMNEGLTGLERHEDE